MGDVEDVLGDVFFYYEPRTTAEAHALTLADGMEPKTAMFADATTGFELDDVAGHLAQIATDIVIVTDLA